MDYLTGPGCIMIYVSHLLSSSGQEYIVMESGWYSMEMCGYYFRGFLGISESAY